MSIGTIAFEMESDFFQIRALKEAEEVLTPLGGRIVDDKRLVNWVR